MPPIKHSRKIGRNLKVLVVEDEVMLGLLAEDILDTLGHTVVGPVARLEKAIEVAQRERLDLAMLDINIGGQEVFPVVDILDNRHIPVIFVSGYDSRRLRTRDQGKPIIEKPYVTEHLRAAIERFYP